MSEFNIAPALTLLPAVDVAGGKAVRLTQGEAGSETLWIWMRPSVVATTAR